MFSHNRQHHPMSPPPMHPPPQQSSYHNRWPSTSPPHQPLPLPPLRTLNQTFTPSLLPDISEHPHMEPSPPKPPSPTRALRSISVASFLSDGTVEIEGFGFDTISEAGGDDTLSMYGSMYDESIFDDLESNAGNEPASGRTTPDISRRAERVLASAKRKLELCGQNLSRARSSMVLSSPSTTPTNFGSYRSPLSPTSSTPYRSPATPTNFTPYRSPLSPRDTSSRPAYTSPVFNSTPRAPAQRSESAAANLQSHSTPRPDLNKWRFELPSNAHARNLSESAVHQYLGTHRYPEDTGSVLSDVLEEDPREKDPTIARSNSSASTLQMRSLRDQMKDLRGKISSIQQQVQNSDVKRRQSISSLRSTPGPYDDAPTALPDIRESAELSPSWDDLLLSPRSGTPTLQNPLSPEQTPRATGNNYDTPLSPQSRPARSDAFTYDTLLHHPFRLSTSSTTTTSSTSTLTAPAPPPLPRNDSSNSIASYATARSARSSPPHSPKRKPPSPPAPRLDDGYHSTPHTPAPPPADSSWYRDSEEVPPPLIMNTVKVARKPVASSVYSQDSVGVSQPGSPVKLGSELRVMEQDRVLIEGVVEALGRVCVELEGGGGDVRMRELRERLQGALDVLDGEEGGMF